MALEIIVQKYGGSSVADTDRIKKVAHFIKSSLHDDVNIVVVVSAMGQTTNELIALAHDISADPPKRELDMLISCGERSSMALLAMALVDIGVSAISLTGSQCGIITDDNHHRAEIIAIKPHRVVDALAEHRVVIIAGFQGVSEKEKSPPYAAVVPILLQLRWRRHLRPRSAKFIPMSLESWISTLA